LKAFGLAVKKTAKLKFIKKETRTKQNCLWARKELDEKGKPKIRCKKSRCKSKRNLPIIGNKTLWNAKYQFSNTGYFENATAYRNGKYFCGKV
jgi:hypothetical protein